VNKVFFPIKRIVKTNKLLHTDGILPNHGKYILPSEKLNEFYSYSVFKSL
jgi:hypothetical protein